MGLVRINPATVNRAFDELFKTHPTRKNTHNHHSPAVNIKETDDDFHLELAVPGLKKENFTLEVKEGILNISAKQSEENEANLKGYTRREFNVRNFSRRFTLPESANDQLISANYTDGILYVLLPKKEEAKPQEPRQIAVV